MDEFKGLHFLPFVMFLAVSFSGLGRSVFHPLGKKALSLPDEIEFFCLSQSHLLNKKFCKALRKNTGSHFHPKPLQKLHPNGKDTLEPPLLLHLNTK